MGERDLGSRLYGIALRAWRRIPDEVKADLLARNLKMVEADLPSDRLADAGADGLIRLGRDLPGGELGQFIIAHECAHVFLGHPGPALRDETKRAQFEDEADALARAWGFRKETRRMWMPGGTSGSMVLVDV